MTNKIDKKLEKGMLQALDGLKEFRRQQEERQDKKHWGNIEIPFTLSKGLGSFSKNELDDIRKGLQLKGASSLKKAELIALLAETIPDLLEKVCCQFDEESFGLLTKIAINGGYMIAPHLEPHQIEYFRSNGLIYTGILNGKKIVAIPNELIEPLKALEKNNKVKSIISRNTEWIKLTNGLLYYYGALSSFEMVELVGSYTKERLDLHAYFDVIFNANSYHKAISINDDGFSNIRVFDPIKLKQEQQMRESVPFYPFTKEQLLKAGEPGFVERNISYVQLVNYLTENYQLTRSDADTIVEECVYATSLGESPNDILQYLANIIEFENLEEINALMDKVVFLMNNTRKWFLKGYTSTELSKRDKNALQPLPKAKFSQNDSKSDEKLGRNDPCPCGSNKKYKKCCGR